MSAEISEARHVLAEHAMGYAGYAVKLRAMAREHRATKAGCCRMVAASIESGACRWERQARDYEGCARNLADALIAGRTA